MGNPDPHLGGDGRGSHPGGQNYPAGTPQPTRPVERDEYGQTRGFDGAYPPLPQGGQAQGPAAEGGQEYPGGYQLGYSGGAYPGYDGSQPPQGPPPGPGSYGTGGGPGDGSGGSNKKVLWIAAAVVAFVLVLAVIVVVVATGGSGSSTTAGQQTVPTTTTTTTAPTTGGGIPFSSGIPSGISIPPLLGGGSSTGPNARSWQVEVTGSGSAQLVTVGVPDTDLFGSQPLPWSKTFTSDSFLVTVTVLGYTGDVACKITRDGTVVAQQNTADGTSGGPLICSAGR